MMKKILITGVLGFIFSNFVRRVIATHPEYQLVGVDSAVFSYNLNNMYKHDRYTFYLADIADKHIINRIFEIERPDIVIHGAAESFVDNSITNIDPFLHTNVIGTQCMIDHCLKYNTQKFIHISTDEVYGQKSSIYDIGWTEDAPLLARNPYACSKAAAELIVRAAHETHNLQFQMTRSCNVYGSRQKKENLVPHIIYSLINRKPIHIHGDGRNFRQYIHVDDKIDAIMKITEHGEINSIYNIGDAHYLRNIEMVHYIANLMDIKPSVEYISDRKAHDYGYKVSTSKIQLLNYQPQIRLDEGMKRTINWYLENKNHYDH